MSTETRYIVQRYPERKAQISRLMLKNPEFRTICSDYGKCLEARKYWDQSNDPSANIKAEDYRYLCKVLEDEILQALEDSVDLKEKNN